MIGISGIMLVILLIADFVYVKALNTKENEPESKIDTSAKDEPSGTVEKESAPQTLYAEETIDYALAEDELHITFNKGKEWIEVPMKQQPFLNEQSSMNNELADGSYLLKKEWVGFLSSKESGNHIDQLLLTYSLDHGNSWRESIVTETYLGNHFWKVDFLDDQFGYIITTGEKVVSQEVTYVYITNDGGQSWQAATEEQLITRLIVDGGFVDTKTGFLSMSAINPTEPEVLVTQDSGKTWKQAVIEIPEQYQEIFVVAEMPYKEDQQLAVLINQGPNGDYKGAKVKGKFTSTDKGATWRFSTEVEADEY